MIGGQDTYMALCRTCFYEKSLERDRDEMASSDSLENCTVIAAKCTDLVQDVVPRKVQILENQRVL